MATRFECSRRPRADAHGVQRCQIHQRDGHMTLADLTRDVLRVALRFAHIKRYRPDKDAADADVIDELRALLPAGP